MANFFAELKRRHIYRVAAGYAVVAWVLLQLVNNVTPIMAAPQWVAQFCLLVLVLGLPLAIFLAWTRELPPSETTSPGKATATDWALIGALVVVIGLVSYQQFAPSSRGQTAKPQEASVTAARSASASVGNAISIAVLPFTNLSSDKEQEFFSDGMTEEITSALAKVPDLRVVARTSAFEFKGKNIGIQTIGEQLHATHLIEGSVRKAGNRVRITAQLIRADDGTHIWAEDYDRDLTDVFAIQEDIARAITASLRMPLGLKPGENLVNNRNIDQESYQQYLRAKALYRARNLANINDALALLEAVLARNPEYAPAWALLSEVHTTLPNYTVFLPTADSVSVEEMRRAVRSSRDKAEPAARKAIQLAPNLADGYRALAIILIRAGKFLEAQELVTKALALDPNNPEVLASQATLLTFKGHLKEAVAEYEQLHALEPFLPNSNRNMALVLWLAGEGDAALAILKAGNQNRFTAMVLAGAGRFSEAADTLSSAPPGSYPSDRLKEAVRLLRIAPQATAPKNPVPLRDLDFVYLFVGAPQRILDYYERNVEADWMTNAQTPLLWHSSFAPARKTERFKALMRKAGFVEYWRAKGWPQFCHPTTGDDFECN